MRIAIDGSGYATANTAFAHGNHAAALRYHQLTTELTSYAAMAGDSSSSADFAASYDAGASDAVAALGDVVAAFTTLGRLTYTSLANHHDAERRSVLPGAAVYPDGELPASDSSYAAVLPSTPPSSLGGDPSSLPDVLNWLLDHVESFVWPDADVDKLRAAATTWRSAARGFDVLLDYCDLAVGGLADEQSPEVALAVDATRELKETLCELAEQYVALAGACEQYAAQVEEQRAALLDFLWDLLRDSMIIEGIGIGLGIFTGGTATAAVTSANASRIAAQLPRLMEFVELIRSAAAAAAGVIRVAGEALGRMRVVLEKFKLAVVRIAGPSRANVVRRERRLAIRMSFRNPRVFNPEQLRGMDPGELRRILSEWESRAATHGEGLVYKDPAHKFRQFRIMDGYPGNRPDPLTHGPYALVSQNGRKFKIPLEGNPVL